ncbi:MAG: modA [Acidimicrobiales bacterium]|jgi:molybdate transport system substrate-binding protein|nr:modA [Acidimicrobiales bacterium]
MTAACGSAASGASGPVTVFAAASLTDVFGALPKSDVRPTFDFAGSQALVTQIQQGAPADVFASADQKSMQKLVDAGLVEAPKVFARNALEIAVAPGNPKHVSGLADLARRDIVVVLADSSVPAGNYAHQALATAGVTVHPKSLELDVKSTLAKVTSGEADAAIVYATDVKAAGAKASGVEIPTAQNVIATYPIAVVKATRHHAAAQAFVDAVRSSSGQRALADRGFLSAA